MMFCVDYWSNSLHSHVIDLEFFHLIASSIGNITLYSITYAYFNYFYVIASNMFSMDDMCVHQTSIFS